MTPDLILAPGTDTIADLNRALFHYKKKDLVVRSYAVDYDKLYAEMRENGIPAVHDGLFEVGIEHFMFMGAAIVRGLGYTETIGTVAKLGMSPEDVDKMFDRLSANSPLMKRLRKMAEDSLLYGSATCDPPGEGLAALVKEITEQELREIYPDPPEPKSAWDAQIEKELREGADTWGRIEKRFKK